MAFTLLSLMNLLGLVNLNHSVGITLDIIEVYRLDQDCFQL